jgi:hypothetical protein
MTPTATAVAQAAVGTRLPGQEDGTGTLAAAPAVINAIVHALAPFGVGDIAMPAAPQRVRDAHHRGRGHQ